jgi:hypothetical protein
LISALMRTAISGRRVEIDTQGIRSIASDETLMVDIPTDKGTATFNGQVLAAALEVLGNSTHRGIGTLTPGAAFVLSLSVPDPITAPTVSVVWDTTEFSDGARSRAGLYWDAANSRWWTGRNFASSGNEVCDIKAYDASGVLQQTIAQSNMPVNAIECAGAVRIGTKVYALLHTWATFPVAVNRWAVHSFDATTGAYIDESTWSDSPSGLVQSNDGIPGFGYDGTNLIVVGITSGGAPTFTKLTVADSPVLVSTTTSTGLALSMTFPRTMSGFAVAEGAWWISTHGGTATGTVYKFTTAGALVTNSDFFTRNFTAIYGLGHDGTQFWTLDAPSIVMVKHTNWIWTTENSGYWVGYTWQNPNETLVSPRASITMYRRAKMRVSNPALQVGASSVRVYTNRGSTEPQAGGRFDGEPQVTDALTVRDLVTFATGTQNPATNTFGAATPAELRSSGGEPLLRANGVPRCRLRTTSSRGIPTGTDHYIRLGTEDVDTDGFHAATTDADSATPDSTYNLVLPFAGSYMAIFRCVWAAGSGGQRQAFLDIGPGTIERITLEVGGGALSVRGNAAWDLDTATTGVIIRLGVLQDSGVALGLSTARLFIWYLGP